MEIKGENGNDIIPVNDSLQAVLNNPNPRMTTSDFLEKVTWLLFLNYNAFIVPTYYEWRDKKDGRVKRRYEQNKQKGLKISEEQVKNDIINRDNNDKKNIVVSEDTIVIDNTNQSLEESLAEMCSHIDRKLGYVWLKV